MLSLESLFALARTLGGLPVLSAKPGSPAARAGIRYGDVVVEVNGRPTPTAGDYVAASALRVGGMAVVVFRRGVEERIELRYEPRASAPEPRAVLASIFGDDDDDD